MIYSICLNRSVVFLVKRANLHSPQRCSTQTLEATLDCNALFPQKSKHWHFPGFFTFTTGWYFAFIISTLVFNPASQPAVLISRLFSRLQCGSGDLVTVSPLPWRTNCLKSSRLGLSERVVVLAHLHAGVASLRPSPTYMSHICSQDVFLSCF